MTTRSPSPRATSSPTSPRRRPASEGRITVDDFTAASSDASVYAAGYASWPMRARTPSKASFSRRRTSCRRRNGRLARPHDARPVPDRDGEPRLVVPANQGLSVYDAVNLASIVEKESSGDEQIRAQVAAVFYNRLRHGRPELRLPPKRCHDRLRSGSRPAARGSARRNAVQHVREHGSAAHAHLLAEHRLPAGRVRARPGIARQVLLLLLRGRPATTSPRRTKHQEHVLVGRTPHRHDVSRTRPLLSRLSHVDIDRDLLALGYRNVLLDVDNTILTRDTHEVPRDVGFWLAKARDAGIAFCLVSNNWHEGVYQLANRLSLPIVAKAVKPLPPAFLMALRKIGATRDPPSSSAISWSPTSWARISSA